jgi:hypothetical protein
MAHAKLSPSSSKQWLSCPGSIRASAGIPRHGSTYAAEGTAGHALAEQCLLQGVDASTYAGWYVLLTEPPQIVRDEPDAIEPAFPVTDEMVDAVQMYLDVCRDHTADGDDWSAETRVKLSDDIWGTADFIRYRPCDKTLFVCDFKYGRGLAVEPKENTQGIIYALGALKRLHNSGVSGVTIGIVQPRCHHPDGPVRLWAAETTDLMAWEDEILAGAALTKRADAPFKSGDWCRFCPAAAVCPTLAAEVQRAAEAEFRQDGVTVLAEAAAYDKAKLADMLGRLDVIEAWCKRVREFAHAEASAGRDVPGWKLVGTRAVRRWVDEAAAAALLSEMGVEADALFVRKLVSPAAAEKLPAVKATLKSDKAALAPIISKVSGGTVLAPVDDPRPAVESAASQFNPVAL